MYSSLVCKLAFSSIFQASFITFFTLDMCVCTCICMCVLVRTPAVVFLWRKDRGHRLGPVSLNNLLITCLITHRLRWEERMVSGQHPQFLLECTSIHTPSLRKITPFFGFLLWKTKHMETVGGRGVMHQTRCLSSYSLTSGQGSQPQSFHSSNWPLWKCL